MHLRSYGARWFALAAVVASVLLLAPPVSAQCAYSALSDSFHSGGDDHSLWLPGISTDLVFVDDGSFVESSDGTASLTGLTLDRYDLNRGFYVQVDLGARTDVAPSGSPKKELRSNAYVNNGGPVDTATWRYYENFSGILTGFGSWSGAVIELTRRGPAFQVGDGASGKNVGFGGSGWLNYAVLQQPTSGSALQGSGHGDFNLDFGTCSPHGGCPADISFEVDGNGQALALGQILDSEWSNLGIQFSTGDVANHPAMIFDTSAPTGGDPDLGTPNEDFGGPGIGSGGSAGSVGENSVAEGLIAIISEDRDSSDPDDRARGGVIIATFSHAVTLDSVTVIDIDGNEVGSARAYDDVGTLLVDATLASLGNNSTQTVPVQSQNVYRLEVQFAKSGGLANIDFCDDGDVPPPPPPGDDDDDDDDNPPPPGDDDDDDDDDDNPPTFASIGDRVWLDADGNGIDDIGEAGLAGVTVGLFNLDNNLLEQTTTGADGEYGFSNLAAGDYQVAVDATTLPDASIATFDADGVGTLFSAAVSVAAGQSEDGADFGFTTATEPVRPVLECVADNGDGSYTAYFGYLNGNADPVIIPVGNRNKFTPNPQDRQQPVLFEPGRTPFWPNAAFSVVFDGNNLVWTLDGRTSTASSGSTPCSAHVFFEKNWVDAITGDLVAPPADLAGFQIIATSDLGQAICTYDGPNLNCVYDNAPPALDNNGLWVPVGGEYTVTEIGLPNGTTSQDGEGVYAAFNDYCLSGRDGIEKFCTHALINAVATLPPGDDDDDDDDDNPPPGDDDDDDDNPPPGDDDDDDNPPPPPGDDDDDDDTPPPGDDDDDDDTPPPPGDDDDDDTPPPPPGDDDDDDTPPPGDDDDDDTPPPPGDDDDDDTPPPPPGDDDDDDTPPPPPGDDDDDDTPPPPPGDDDDDTPPPPPGDDDDAPPGDGGDNDTPPGDTGDNDTPPGDGGGDAPPPPPGGGGDVPPPPPGGGGDAPPPGDTGDNDNPPTPPFAPPVQPPANGEGVSQLSFWRAHPQHWPVEDLTIGGVTYTKTEALDTIRARSNGDQTYTLFRNLAAARLNNLAGNGAGCVAAEIEAADLWLAQNPVGSNVRGRDNAWRRDARATNQPLVQYSKGELCVPARVRVRNPNYFQRHQEAWPVDRLAMGDAVQTRQEVVDTMAAPHGGDQTFNLYDQLVGAKVNRLRGTNGGCIDATILAADAWLTQNPVGSDVRGRDNAWRQGGRDLRDTLRSYNRGQLCALP